MEKDKLAVSRKNKSGEPVKTFPELPTERPEEAVKALPQSKNFRLIRLILIFLPIIFISFLLYFYFNIYLSPANVLLRTYQNLDKFGSAKYSLLFEVRLIGNNQNTGSFLPGNDEYLNLKTQVPSDYKISGEGSLVSKNNGFAANSALNITSDRENILQGNLIFKDSDLFWKLNDSGYKDLIREDLLNKWIRVGKDFWQDKYGLKSEPDMNNTQNNAGRPSADLLVKNPPLTIMEVLPDDKVGGYSSVHYKYKLNQDNLIKIIGLGTSGGPDSDKERQDVGAVIKNINFTEGDIWIGKKSNSVYKISGSASYENVGSEGNKIIINFDITFMDINKNGDIAVPDSYTDIKNVIR